MALPQALIQNILTKYMYTDIILKKKKESNIYVRCENSRILSL